MLLDQVKKPLFIPKVVIHPSQRHAGFGRNVAHRSASVSFVTEDLRGAFEDPSELLLEMGPVGWDCSSGLAGKFAGLGNHGTFERSF
jgi:hypothetical protein